MNTPIGSSTSGWLNNLMPHFLQQTKDRLTEIEAHKKAVHDGNDVVAAMKAICDVAHKISGTADTFGFGDLGVLAQNVEKMSLLETMPFDDTSVAWSRMEPALILLIDEILNVLKK